MFKAAGALAGMILASVQREQRIDSEERETKKDSLSN